MFFCKFCQKIKIKIMKCPNWIYMVIRENALVF